MDTQGKWAKMSKRYKPRFKWSQGKKWRLHPNLDLWRRKFLMSLSLLMHISRCKTSHCTLRTSSLTQCTAYWTPHITHYTLHTAHRILHSADEDPKRLKVPIKLHYLLFCLIQIAGRTKTYKMTSQCTFPNEHCTLNTPQCIL